ncbi:MAG: efflux RND transporter periplasmic adaptor subunit [Planctomycetota bacterium]
MISSQTADFRFQHRRWTTLIICFGIVAFALTAISSAQIQGFIEPFKTVELSSDESGSISELVAEEGRPFLEGEILAQLDDRVQAIQLKIAEELAGATSQVVAAEQTFKKRQEIYDQLMELQQRGHASESEIIRGTMELSIARAKYLSALEEKAVRELELERARLQLERRRIRAPFDGIVSRIHRQEGEFLSPLRPEVVTFVKTDRLLAAFAVPSSEVYQLQIGSSFDIQISGGSVYTATVYSIGVETDAQSGTVLVKLVSENTTFELRAGEACTLTLG